MADWKSGVKKNNLKRLRNFQFSIHRLWRKLTSNWGSSFFFSWGFFSCCIDPGCHWSPRISSPSWICQVLQMQYQWVRHGCSVWDCLCFIKQVKRCKFASNRCFEQVCNLRSRSFSRLNLSLGPWFHKFSFDFSVTVTISKSRSLLISTPGRCSALNSIDTGLESPRCEDVHSRSDCAGRHRTNA